MPCFKGLAVSVHTPDGPIAEHGIQRQTRNSRISSYISVPPAKVPPWSLTGKPEQSSFGISITLLTPGLNVPYSTPKPTPDNPYPCPRVVGGLPGCAGERGKYHSSIPPYIPRTTNPNETIAAYIYFDGRTKEDVATLLRRGEETWVNSRWISVPDSEGGGLAECEFLFREVGLERWLSGLDLEGSGKDKAERIERRQRRLDKKREKLKQKPHSDDEDPDKASIQRSARNGVLRYGEQENSPVEDLPHHEHRFSSVSDSDDDLPQPEAAGQIKVALFRVIASGEVKRGEYSPQFVEHEDDTDGAVAGGGGDDDVDHTTTFASPKTLDPMTISTQTVTGLDPPEAPYAVFTFFYRGEKQLQKMGILPNPDKQSTPQTSKRKSSGPDFSKFGPLKPEGTVGYSGYRDPLEAKRKSKKSDADADAMDSDADDEEDERLPDGPDDAEDKQVNRKPHWSPEDAKRTNEVAEGVQRIKLKRQHSAEPLSESSVNHKSPHVKGEDSAAGTPQSISSVTAAAGTPPNGIAHLMSEASDDIASPFKRQRASLPGLTNSNHHLFASEAGFFPLTSPTNSTVEKPDDNHVRALSTPEIKRTQDEIKKENLGDNL